MGLIAFMVLCATLMAVMQAEGLRWGPKALVRQQGSLRLQQLYCGDEDAPVLTEDVKSDMNSGDKNEGGVSAEIKLKLVSAKDKGGIKYLEDGTQYIMCSQCKSSFLYDEEQFGAKGRKVKCGVCEKEWFQSGNRVLTTDKNNSLMGMTEEKVAEIRKSIDMRNWPRFPKTDRIGVFVGNLPYNYDEKEIGEIFAEYGITNISLVRDPTGLSKGFAFVETANPKDAEKMIEEMHHFNTDEERRLTVRLATQPGQRAGGGRREGGGGGGDRNNGGGEKRVWQKRGR